MVLELPKDTTLSHCTLFTDNDVMTYDDAKIIKKNKSILKNNNFSDAKKLTESCSWYMSNDEKSLIENIWFDDVKMSSLTITGENIRSLSFQRWVNGDVINCFLK